MILEYKGKLPTIHPTAYIADNAVITGDVIIEEDVSIWFHTVIRGDVAPVYIGKKTNIQDQSMLHQSPNKPLIIEEGVTAGHQVMIHSAHVKRNALIGMGTTLLDGCQIGEGAYIGAGSLVPPNKIIPANTLAFGRPAKVIRELSDDDSKEMNRIRNDYMKKGRYYKSMQKSD
ncbi:gamma carbonic anhydrase [Pontibacillus litoralis]|uniref:Transferase n=1 Tax=Pontibacillus litoralis JSM 072002 TaxID=1385512 RepID=A0A0A5HSZ1_9BACI|nr:gamma carbonic anhydrase family protein [Pontibacillus litoralis]KGX86762.1 transferase [Pontibacillus litoralis JSM 072002]